MAEALWVLEDKPIPVSFKTQGYSFYKGGSGVLGSPMEAYLRLVAVKGNQKSEIQKPSDLAGKVVIDSPGQALEFVRLFTSPATEYLFPRIKLVEPFLAPNDGGGVEYTDEYRLRVNIKGPTARQEDEFFVIERPLLDGSGTLFQAVERVGRDGAYSLIQTTVLDPRSPIRYPLYE